MLIGVNILEFTLSLRRTFTMLIAIELNGFCSDKISHFGVNIGVNKWLKNARFSGFFDK